MRNAESTGRLSTLRGRVSKTVMASLLAGLFVPVISLGTPTLIDAAQAATANCTTGSLTYSLSGTTVNGNFTNNSCTGIIDLSSTSITDIPGSFALANATGITGIKFPTTLTAISGYAALYNDGFTSLSLPCSLGAVGGQTLQEAASLISVQMCADGGTPSSNFNMGYYSFGGNPNLVTFSFGSTLASTVNVTTWNDASNNSWGNDSSLKWIQYCGSGPTFAAMTAHLVYPYVPAGVVVSCTPPSSVLGSLGVTSNGNNYSAGGVTNNLLSITLPSGKEINDNSSYTVETWVKVDAATNSSSTLGYGSLALSNTEFGRTDAWNQRNVAPSTTNSYYMVDAGTNVAYCDGTDPAILCPNVVVPKGQWTHVALQKSIIAGQTRMTIFINGQVLRLIIMMFLIVKCLLKYAMVK